VRNRPIRFCALALFLIAAPIRGRADEPTKQQTWSFQGQSGTVKIKASQYDNEPSTALDLWVETGQSGIEEEGRFLSFVLIELPKSGFEVSSLSILLFRLDQTDADKRIAPYAAKSKSWNSAARARSARVTYPAVTAMLNDSGVFKGWFDLFRANGIDGKVAGIEKLGMNRFRETGATCPAAVDCSRVLVPATALVQINFQPLQQN
jgi:hypothetical protein